MSFPIPQLMRVQRGMLQAMVAVWATQPLAVLMCARRLGKTHLLCAYADFVARHKPNATIKYAAATEESVIQFALPCMRKVLDAWGGAQPVWKASDSTWHYPNGSRIVMVGCDEKRKADRLRGPACDLVIVDEAAFIANLDYVVESVFRYQLVSQPVWRDGRIVGNSGTGLMVIASSAPESSQHPFALYVEGAAEKVIKRTIWDIDADRMSREEIVALCEQAGGERSTSWRREALCEIITDATSAAVPEMAACKGPDGKWLYVVRKPALVPQYRWRATVIDGGHVDLLVAALGYVDFLRQTLVIEREVVMQRATSAEIALAVRAAERQAWGDVEPDLRAADFPPQTLADLVSHGLRCQAVPKPDKASSVTHLRDLVQARRLEIDPELAPTIVRHVEGGQWAPNRKNWLRREATPLSPAHHFDGLDAARYLADVADFRTDPRPSPVPLGVQHGFRRPATSGLERLGTGLSGMGRR